MPTTDKYGYRDYLKERGIKNNQIGYQNGNVTVDGRFFASATPQADGRTYGTRDELEKAYGNYQNTRRADVINQRNNSIYDEISGLRNQLNQPRQQFSFNPQTDPQYQAALRQARANSQAAAGNIAADMNKRGLLNSTITADRGNQAAQREYGRVSDTVLPALISQAYQQYADEQNRQRQSTIDQLGLLESQAGLVQNDDANLYRDRVFDRNVLEDDRNFGRGVLESDRSFDRNVLESDRNFGRGVLENDRSFNRGVLESNRNFGLQNRQVAVSEKNANTAQTEAENAKSARESQQQFENGMTIYQQTGQMPDWMQDFGINVQALNVPETKAEVEGLYQELSGGATSPEEALKRIDDAVKLGLKDETTANELRNSIYMLFPEVSPEAKEEQQNRNKAVSTGIMFGASQSMPLLKLFFGGGQ